MSIQRLGIAALPMIINKIEEGDIDLISMLPRLTNGEVKKEAKAEDVVNWWKGNKHRWLIPFPNKQPEANAGKNIKVSSREIVQLDGTKSKDIDGDALVYRWEQISGLEVQLSDSTSATPFFTAPFVRKVTHLIFELTVVDGYPETSHSPVSESGISKPSTVKIQVTP